MSTHAHKKGAVMNQKLSRLRGELFEAVHQCASDDFAALSEIIRDASVALDARHADRGAVTIPEVDRSKMSTTRGGDVAAVLAEQAADGNTLHRDYIVLSDEERTKGFVRPVRRSYKHVGPRPRPGTRFRDLSEGERANYGDDFAKFEEPTEFDNPVDSWRGKYWTHEEWKRHQHPCGSVTTMSQSIAETYARDPKFYGSTFCVACGAHFRVGADGEFEWLDGGGKVGT